jgi:hypothetical protein
MKAYEEAGSEKAREELVMEVTYGKTGRKIGPTTSKILAQFFCTRDFEVL